ncbi:MAG: alpha-isopropylmalate synthase regulatory domain-containing protein [Patescibacteria group bacterium]|jgi:hypothetical protein
MDAGSEEGIHFPVRYNRRTQFAEDKMRKTNVTLGHFRRLGLDLSGGTAEFVAEILGGSGGYEVREVVSLGMRLLQSTPGYELPFVADRYRIYEIGDSEGHSQAEATLNIRIRGVAEPLHVAAPGNGPVCALDMAARRALKGTYPGLEQLTLTDYTVKPANGSSGADSPVRVHVEWELGELVWATAAMSKSVTAGSWIAISDAFEFALLTLGGG